MFNPDFFWQRTSLYAPIELQKTLAMSQKQKWLDSSRGFFQEGFESSEGDRQSFEAHPDIVTGHIRTVRSSETADRYLQLTLDCPRPQFCDKLVPKRHFKGKEHCISVCDCA